MKSTPRLAARPLPARAALPSRKAAFGLTLVEMLAAIAVMLVAIGAVLPDFSRLVQRQRLEGAAALLETELQFARSHAVTLGKSVHFNFSADNRRSCYVIHTGAAQACRCEGAAVPVCVGDAVALRSVAYEATDGLRVTSNAPSFLFDATKGTVTPTATLSLANDRGDVLRLVVNLMGRVRDCTPTGLPGHRAC